MNPRVAALSMFALLLATGANAQTWESPDGFLSVTPPDPAQFEAMPAPPPPFLCLWVSRDGSMKFGIVKLEVPAGVELIQSSVEEGLSQEVGGGPATRLPTKVVSGHNVWKMAARGPSAEITQAIVRHDRAVYKLMAATVGGPPDAAAVDRFVDSLAIRPAAAPAPPIPPPSGPAREPGEGADLHALSKRIGGLAALLGIGLVIFLVLRGKQAKA